MVDSLKYVLIFLFDTHLDSCHGRVRVPGLRKILQRAVIPTSASGHSYTNILRCEHLTRAALSCSSSLACSGRLPWDHSTQSAYSEPPWKKICNFKSLLSPQTSSASVSPLWAGAAGPACAASCWRWGCCPSWGMIHLWFLYLRLDGMCINNDWNNINIHQCWHNMFQNKIYLFMDTLQVNIRTNQNTTKRINST